MKKKSGKECIVSAVLMLLTGLLINIRTMIGLIGVFTADEPEHIGIIGGADAPTAIFLTDRIFADMSIFEKAGLLLIIISLVLVIIGIVKCRRNKHSS